MAPGRRRRPASGSPAAARAPRRRPPPRCPPPAPGRVSAAPAPSPPASRRSGLGLRRAQRVPDPAASPGAGSRAGLHRTAERGAAGSPPTPARSSAPSRSRGRPAPHKMMEISNLVVIKQNLDYLNANLENDLQRLDEANQILLRKIQEKEETIESLERDITLSVGKAKERKEMEQILSDKEDTLRALELETAKLEKKKKILARNLRELRKKVSRRCKNAVLSKGTLKQSLVELKVQLRKSTESCIQQEKEMVKIESDYQSVYQLCEDQAHYIKKYQEILRHIEKEKDVLLLEKEISKAQNNSSQTVKPGSILVESIKNNMEKTLIKKQKKVFWYRHIRCLVFMIMIFIRLLGYVVFYLQYMNPDFLTDTLPMVMSRRNLKRLRDLLFPFLTLETEEVLPH
ncbi:transmembrane and coiled-coil domain-containing protein 5B-like [Perognathus longimembris pacificus]|uniref:transmembrane and coiled-coil domain-containing protein 5B-like n=1 Tax=Perognathus longimembris pacificus TaxID=214514 RepID=UPI00201887F3|nr:transmembrane and coiled-coil domain-containing protein 5B-like [Perognathus longimembris pacificus]